MERDLRLPKAQSGQRRKEEKERKRGKIGRLISAKNLNSAVLYGTKAFTMVRKAAKIKKEVARLGEKESYKSMYHLFRYKLGKLSFEGKKYYCIYL